MTGDTLCTFVKARPELAARVSVVIVTARNDEKELQRCFASGCDAYVTKPIDGSDLLGKMEILLEEIEARESGI